MDDVTIDEREIEGSKKETEANPRKRIKINRQFKLGSIEEKYTTIDGNCLKKATKKESHAKVEPILLRRIKLASKSSPNSPNPSQTNPHAPSKPQAKPRVPSSSKKRKNKRQVDESTYLLTIIKDIQVY